MKSFLAAFFLMALMNIARSQDMSQAMVNDLAASGPHSSLGEQAHVFERMLGVWDADWSLRLKDGSVRHVAGELKFGWVLDGRAIQDLWISYPQSGEKERTIGTSIRFFDPKEKVWTVVFVAPAFPGVLIVKGGA